MVQAFPEASASSELQKKFPVGMKHRGSLCSQKPFVMTCRIMFTSVLIHSGPSKRSLHLEFLSHNSVCNYLFLV
jgi:hypothetical protein